MQHKGLMIGLIVLIFVLIITIIGGGYFILKNQPHKEEQIEVKEENTKEEAFFKAEMNDFILNITNDKNKEKLFKLSFVLKSNNPQFVRIIEKYKRDITDITITTLSSKNSTELLTVNGKNLLKEELIKEINNVLNEASLSEKELKMETNMVKSIYFSDFIIK